MASQKPSEYKQNPLALYVVYRYTSYRKETDFETIKAFHDYYDACSFATEKCIQDGLQSDELPDSGYLYRNEEITYDECVLHFREEHEEKTLIRLCCSTGELEDVWCIYKLENLPQGLEDELTITLRMEAELEDRDNMVVPYITYDKTFNNAPDAKKYCFEKAKKESRDGKVHSDFNTVENNWKKERDDYHYTDIGPNVQVGTQGKNVWAYHTVPIIPKSKEDKYVILIETKWDDGRDIPKQFFSFLQHSGNEEVIAKLSDLLRPEINAEYNYRGDQKYDFSLEDNYRVDESTAFEMATQVPQRCRVFRGKMLPLADPAKLSEINKYFPISESPREESPNSVEDKPSIRIIPGNPEEWKLNLLSVNTREQFSRHLPRGYDGHPYYEFD